MKTRYTVVLSMIAGAAVGAVAIQGLHAQAKPKVDFISESEVVDRAAVDAWNSQVQQAIKAAGGNLVVGEINLSAVVTFVTDWLCEWGSLSMRGKTVPRASIN